MSDNRYDVIFVGSGASSSYTLIHFVQVALQSGMRVRIGVVEKTDEFYTGIAYGRRSGEGALTITTLKDFLPRDELDRYLKWSKQHDIAVRRQPVSKVIQKMQCSGEQIEIDIENVCTSRRHYGEFLSKSVRELCQKGNRDGNIVVEEIIGEVVDISTVTDNQFICEILDSEGVRTNLISQEVILALGSGSTRDIPSDKQHDPGIERKPIPANGTSTLYLKPYEEDFDEALAVLFKSIANHDAEKSLQILLVGANASALEVLFFLWLRWNNGETSFRIELISNAGVLPEIHQVVSSDHSIESLKLNIAELKSLTADELNASSMKLIMEGQFRELPLSAYSNIVNNQIFTALKLMRDDEAIRFLRTYAVSIGRHQRKAEKLYRKAADELVDAGVLLVQPGTVTSTDDEVASGSVGISYGDGRIEHKRYDYIVNCMGCEPVDISNSSALISNLLKSRMVESESLQSGFVVNNEFMTPSGLHVMGPLLSGNFIRDKPVWHMEHLGRIYEFSKELAGLLHERLAANR